MYPWRETAPDALLKYVHHVRPPIGDIRVKPRQREEKPAVAVAIVVAAADSLRFTTLAEIPPLSAQKRCVFPRRTEAKKACRIHAQTLTEIQFPHSQHGVDRRRELAECSRG